MMKLVECVPNFSSSDKSVIEQIVKSINAVNKTEVLHIDIDKDYNRTVVTFITHQDYVLEAGFEAIQTATKEIDMAIHQGEHPRLGATDVFPLIPLQDSTYDECIALARKLAHKVGQMIQIPVYCYGKAALTPDRIKLADIRRGEYEQLPKKLSSQDWKPDYGPTKFIPKSGACVIGVRNFLIAYNVNLQTEDVKIANKVSRNIRTSGCINPRGKHEPGYLNGIQAIGVTLERKDRGKFVQVSTNVLDYENKDSIHNVFEAVKRECQEFGITVTGSEIVGLVPQACLDKARLYYKKDSSTTIEDVISILGLNDLYEFNPALKIIDRHIGRWLENQIT